MRKTKAIFVSGFLVTGLILTGAGCFQTAEAPVTQPTTTTPKQSSPTTTTNITTTSTSTTVMDDLESNAEVGTFAAATNDANLGSSLRAAGPFTVFAPSNAAFDKVPTSTIEKMLGVTNRQNLINTITFHVVPGKYNLKNLKDGQALKTVNGEDLQVRISGDNITINGAVLAATSEKNVVNGVYYVIDKVLFPKNFSNTKKK